MKLYRDGRPLQRNSRRLSLCRRCHCLILRNTRIAWELLELILSYKFCLGWHKKNEITYENVSAKELMQQRNKVKRLVVLKRKLQMSSWRLIMNGRKEILQQHVLCNKLMSRKLHFTNLSNKWKEMT